MSAKIKYTDEPLGKVQMIPDFLPSPAELAFREEGVKVTLALSKKSIEFFKSEAMKASHSVPTHDSSGFSMLMLMAKPQPGRSTRTLRDKAAQRR
jgi:hypothetical protein